MKVWEPALQAFVSLFPTTKASLVCSNSYQMITLKMKIVFLGAKYVTLQYQLVRCFLFKSLVVF